jgi:hypothetical protein
LLFKSNPDGNRLIRGSAGEIGLDPPSRITRLGDQAAERLDDPDELDGVPVLPQDVDLRLAAGLGSPRGRAQ